jgi:hypothetical protein
MSRRFAAVPQALKTTVLQQSARLGLLTASFSMRDISVVGLTPKSSAAPAAPLIFQPVFQRTWNRFRASVLRMESASLLRFATTPVPGSRRPRQ